MTTLAERMQELINAGYAQIDLARAAGVTKGTSNQWLSGGIKSIKLEYAQGIESLTGYSAEWLVTGKGEKKRADVKAGSSYGRRITDVIGSTKIEALGDEEEHPGAVRIRKVKLRLSAGIAGFSADSEEGDDNPIFFRKSWLEARGYRRENLIAIPVKGQSMEPGLYEGDTVVINTAETTPKDGQVFAVNYEGEAVIKRMLRDYGFWWLSSDNTDKSRYPNKRCEGQMCIPIGRVIHKQSEQI